MDVDVIRGLEGLFERHAPETLLALFGAGTSLLLFYLIGVILRQWFGLQRRSADVDASQEQATAALVEALVGALVTEAGHLRQALDGILEEALRRSEQQTQSHTVIQAQTEGTPDKVLELLRPEFAHLHQAINRAEARIVAQIGQRANSAAEPAERAEVEEGPQEPERGADSRHSG
jgi:dsRNA-specific ribonuclease